MDIEVIFKDSEDSDLPCGKEFRYNSQDGYKVNWVEGYEYLEDEEEEVDDDDENE